MKKKSKSVELLREKQEKGWRVELSGSRMPEYKAELDPYCPRAQVRKYNQDKRLNAEAAADKTTRTKEWIEKKLTNTFEEVPLKFNPTLRMKAQAAKSAGTAGTAVQDKGSENLAEIEILQKVIVRENLLSELKRLLMNQTDVQACLGEVVELVKAIRYQTVEIVEDVSTWQLNQPTRRAFLYRGANYLVKIFEDLSFLDQYEDITGRFCFEFTGNPLAYRGGGDICTGPGGNVRHEGVEKLAAFYNQDQGNFDGIEVVRLRNAEKVIQMEFDRLDQERTIFAKQNAYAEEMRRRASQDEEAERGYAVSRSRGAEDMAVGELGMGSSMEAGDSRVFMGSQEMAAASRNIQQREAQAAMKAGSGSERVIQKVPATPNRKWKQKFNARKVKAERAAVLTAEADELKAMETHLDDKITVLVNKHKELSEKRALAETRRREAQSQSREAAAQHLTVEISLHTADMQDINASIKDLQRQIYFIAIERNRKRKVVKKLHEEIEQDKKRAGLEKQLAEKIKEGGLINALKALNKIQSKDLEAAVGFVPGGSPPKRAKNESEAESIVSFLEDFQNRSLQQASYAGSAIQEASGDEQADEHEDYVDDEYADGDNADTQKYITQNRQLANAALTGARAGRAAYADEEEEAAFGVNEDLPAGSGISLARARRAQAGDSTSTEEQMFSLKSILSEAKEKLEFGKFAEARDLLADVLSPVQADKARAVDAAIGTEARYVLAETNRALANYVDAESLYLRCLSDLEGPLSMKIAGGAHHKTALLLSVMVGLADLYRNQCLYEDARDMLFKAKTLNASIGLGENSPSGTFLRLAQAEYLTSAGAFALALGDYTEAEERYKEALDVRRAVLGLDHYKVASSLTHLGRLAMQRDDFKKAARLIGEGLAMRESIFEEPHPAVGASYYLKAQLLQRMGQHKESGFILSRSLQVRRLCLPPKHPSVAESVWGQGELTRVSGYPRQAQECYDEALRLRIKTNPEGGRSENHICVIRALMGLGTNAHNKGFFSDAHKYYEVAANKLQHLFPQRLVSDHPLEHELNLRRADLCCDMDAFPQALQWACRAGDVLMTKLGSCHSAVADGLLVFAKACMATAKYEEADTCLNRALHIFVFLFGDEHPAVATIYLLQAQNSRLLGYFPSALAAEAEASNLRKRQFVPHCGLYAQCDFVRACIWKDACDYAQALQLLQNCLEVYATAYGENSAYYAQILAEYGDGLRLSEKHKEADDVLSRAAVYVQESHQPLVQSPGSSQALQSMHTKHALVLQYRSQLYMDCGRNAEAAHMVERDLYPAVLRTLGKEHPMALYLRGLVALSARRLGQGYSEARPSSSLAEINAENAQAIIDETLCTLDSLQEQRSPMGDKHPWVIALGGYAPSDTREERNIAICEARESFRRAARAGRLADAVAGPMPTYSTPQAWLERDIAESESEPIEIPTSSKKSNRNAEQSNRLLFRHNLKFDGESAQDTKDLQVGLELGMEKKDMGLFQEARAILEDVLKARRRLELVNNGTIMLARLALADLHRGMADYNEANSLFEKCASQIEVIPEEDVPERPLLQLICFTGLADLARNQCLYAQVQDTLAKARESLAVLEAADDARLGTDAFRLAIADYNCCEAAFSIHKGEYENARDSYLFALSVRREVLGPHHYKVASAIAHLGHVAMLRDDYERATRLIGESLMIRESIFQTTHPAVGASYYWKARLLQRLGHFQESGRFMYLSLQSRMASGLGHKHPSVAESLYGLGDIIRAVGLPLHATDRYDEALALYQNPLLFPSINMGSNTVWHRKTCDVMLGLARNAEDCGGYKKAAELLEQVLIQRHMLLKPCEKAKYVEVAELQLRLARIYCMLNRVQEAQSLVDKAGVTVFSLLGEHHRPTKSQPLVRHGTLSAELFYTLGLISNFRGHYCDAADCYDKARRIWHSVLHYTTAAAYSYARVEEDSSISPEPVEESALNEDLNLLDPAAIGIDLKTYFQSLDKFRLDDKATDICVPEYVHILEAQCVNMSLNGPGYLNEAWDLAERAQKLCQKLYASCPYWDRESALFWFDPETERRVSGRATPTYDSLPLAHSMLLMGMLVAARSAGNEVEENRAAVLYNDALRIYLEQLGSEHSAFYAVAYGQKGVSLLQQLARQKPSSPDSNKRKGKSKKALPELSPEALRVVDETLSKALVLRRQVFGDQHVLIADSMQHIASLLLLREQYDEALALMKDGAVPMCETTLGHEHPLTLFMGGCVGNCLLRSGLAQRLDENTARYEMHTGREMIRAVLEFFKNYKQGLFTPAHPWVLTLGSYDVLVRMAAKAPGQSASNDHEAEDIQTQVQNIPTRSSVGLVWNPAVAAIGDSLELWSQALQDAIASRALVEARLQEKYTEDDGDIQE